MSKQYVNLSGLTVYDEEIKNYINNNTPDLIEITQAEYDALTNEQKMDPSKYYYITDAVVRSDTLEELNDVAITNPTQGQVLSYSASDQYWKNRSIITGATVSADGTLILY